jgi:hypothetical protein
MIYCLDCYVMIISITMIGALLSAVLLLHYDEANAVNNTNFSPSMVKFFFHLKNKHIFNNVKIAVTGEKGQSNAWRLILFISDNIQRDAIPGYFHTGEHVTACITNYSKNSYKNCAGSAVTATSEGEGHFNLTAAPS